jgi:hypothetical protein
MMKLKNNNKNNDNKKRLIQPKLNCQTHNLSHKIRITLLKIHRNKL